MKFLWRILILFFLPGLIAGGCTVAAFFRLADSGLELLKIQCYAAILWTSAAWLIIFFCRRISGIYRFYYPVSALMAIGFSLVVGLCRYWGGCGLGEGVAGVVISALATGLIALAFCSNTYTLRDRISWVAGCLCGGAIWVLATFYLRLAWMETFFFFLCIILLLTWLAASPLTRRGSLMRRWMWRVVLFSAAVGAYWVTPVFSFRPWNPPPAAMADGLWIKTYITPQGSAFGYIKKDDTKQIFSPDGRWLAGDIKDDNLTLSIIALKVCVPGQILRKMRLAAPENSLIPAVWGIFDGHVSTYYRFPESLNRCRRLWPGVVENWFEFFPVEVLPHQQSSLFLLTALPENAYPGFLRRFFEYNFQYLYPDSVVAVSGNLLHNPFVFSYLNERFAHSTVLPTPGNIWLFADFPLNVELKKLEDALDKYFDCHYESNTPIPKGVFSVLADAAEANASGIYPTPAAISWGNNSLYKPWWVFLLLAGVVLLWRFLRLFGERRNIMYSWWNSVENGFAGMGVFLLAAGLLLTEYGFYALAPAVLSLVFVFTLIKYPAGGVWLNLLGFILLLAVLVGWHWGIFLLVPILIQTMLFTGNSYPRGEFSVAGQKSLLAGTYLGMVLAALFMAAVWCWAIPLLAAWGIFFAARLPGIWQTANKGVY